MATSSTTLGQQAQPTTLGPQAQPAAPQQPVATSSTTLGHQAQPTTLGQQAQPTTLGQQAQPTTLGQQAQPAAPQQPGQPPPPVTPENRPWGPHPPFAIPMHFRPPGRFPQHMPLGPPGRGPAHYGYPGYGHPGNWYPPQGHHPFQGYAPPPHMASPHMQAGPPPVRGQPHPAYGHDYNQALANPVLRDNALTIPDHQEEAEESFDYNGVQEEVALLQRVVPGIRNRTLPEARPQATGPPYTPCRPSKKPGRSAFADLRPESPGRGADSSQHEGDGENSTPLGLRRPQKRATEGRLAQANPLPAPPKLGPYEPLSSAPTQSTNPPSGDNQRRRVDIDEENEISRRLGEIRLRGDALEGRPDIHINLATGEMMKYFYERQTTFVPRTREKEEEAERIRRAFANNREGKPIPPDLEDMNLTISRPRISLHVTNPANGTFDRDPSSTCIWCIPLSFALHAGGTRYEHSLGPNSRLAAEDPFV